MHKPTAFEQSILEDFTRSLEHVPEAVRAAREVIAAQGRFSERFAHSLSMVSLSPVELDRELEELQPFDPELGEVLK